MHLSPGRKQECVSTQQAGRKDGQADRQTDRSASQHSSLDGQSRGQMHIHILLHRCQHAWRGWRRRDGRAGRLERTDGRTDGRSSLHAWGMTAPCHSDGGGASPGDWAPEDGDKDRQTPAAVPIVCVLPAPVWPYANTVALCPSRTVASTRGLTCSRPPRFQNSETLPCNLCPVAWTVCSAFLRRILTPNTLTSVPCILTTQCNSSCQSVGRSLRLRARRTCCW
jgi:hypothetical protein